MKLSSTSDNNVTKSAKPACATCNASPSSYYWIVWRKILLLLELSDLKMVIAPHCNCGGRRQDTCLCILRGQMSLQLDFSCQLHAWEYIEWFYFQIELDFSCQLHAWEYIVCTWFQDIPVVAWKTTCLHPRCSFASAGKYFSWSWALSTCKSIEIRCWRKICSSFITREWCNSFEHSHVLSA